MIDLLSTPSPNNQQQKQQQQQPDFVANNSGPATKFPPPPNPNQNQGPNDLHARPHQPPSYFAQQQQSQQNFPPHNQQPDFAPPQRQSSFTAHGQPNLALPQRPAGPSDFSRGQQQQQQHFSATNEIASLSGHPQFPSPDQSLILSNNPNNPSQSHFLPTSTNNPYYFPASGYQSFSQSTHPRFFAQSNSRAAQFDHPHLFNPYQEQQHNQHQPQQQHQQQHQQQQHHRRNSSEESIITCDTSSLMSLPQFIQTGAYNGRVASRQEAMQQINFTTAANNDDGGPSSSFNNSAHHEIHNAIRQVNETLNVIRNEMVIMHEQVHQNIYAMHRDTYAMQGRNNGSIERVIKMLNYSERNNLARTMNSKITSQTQLLEPLLTSDGVRPEGFPVDLMALKNLDIHQVTALCELYSLDLTGGLEQKMQRLRMFIGITRA